MRSVPDCPVCGSKLISGEDQYADAWICASCNAERTPLESRKDGANDDYARALARLDGMPGLGDLYYLVRALLVERRHMDACGIVTHMLNPALSTTADAALREFAGGKDA